MQTTKNTIESLPLDELHRLQEPLEREDWCRHHNLLSKDHWIWPQVLAHYGRWQVEEVNDQPDLVQTLKRNIRSDWDLGLWTLVTRIPRGQLVRRQGDHQSANWSMLVPVILAALKRDQNILYNQWPRGELHRVLLPPLWDAVHWADSAPGQVCRDLGSEELVKIRTEALVTRTGKTAGKPKNPLSTWTLTGLQGTPLWGTPKLVSTMLCQVWVAHPQLRTGYMILDPWDLDRIPPSLWGENLFSHNESFPDEKPQTHTELKLPWE